jgi:hypothetical protein
MDAGFWLLDPSLIQNDVSLTLRIPVCNPDWTDHDASEPGITLVEVFAFDASALQRVAHNLPSNRWASAFLLIRMISCAMGRVFEMSSESLLFLDLIAQSPGNSDFPQLPRSV